jgi:allantoate deiminase
MPSAPPIRIERPSAAWLAAAAEVAMQRCNRLSTFSETTFAITRTFLRPPMHDVHGLVGEWMRGAGMAVRVDNAGNIIGRLESPYRAGAPALVIGSHLDTVPNAGRYDGVLGVIMGLAVAEWLAAHPVPFAFEVIGFSEEEGVRYRTPYLGSRAVAGSFDPILLSAVDGDGIPMGEAIRAFGLDPAAIGADARPPGSIIAFVEPHIEQGPVLDELQIPVGVVDAIIGQERFLLRFEGASRHAGTVPMDKRRDALVAAARFVLAVEEHGRAVPGLRATVGALDVRPGARNVIPGEAVLSLDVRHADDAIRVAAAEHLLHVGHRIAESARMAFRVEHRDGQSSVPTNRALTDQLAAAVADCGFPVERMVSGAGHDASVMAPVFPSTMLFLRNPMGISHHPDESVRPDDVAAGLGVLIALTQQLHPTAQESHP